VLRITLPDRDAACPVFILEGKLAGEWVKELVRVANAIGPRANCIFNLEEVSYVDALGEKALCWLNQSGAKFTTETAYGKDLCQRLGLRRAVIERKSATKVRHLVGGK